MENIGIFYNHLKYIMAIWYIIWPYGNLVVIWYIYPRFGILYYEKPGNPATCPGGTLQATQFFFSVFKKCSISSIQIGIRVARFFLVQNTKTGKCTKLPRYTPNARPMSNVHKM
jgi:hypothetical protein